MSGSMKRALFGGAILTAGLMAPVADAQNFSFSYTNAQSDIFDGYDYTPYIHDAFAGAGFYSTSAYADGGFAKLDGTATSISGRANSVGSGYLGGDRVLVSYFQVDQNASAGVSWDFSGDQDPFGLWIDSRLVINDLTDFVNVFTADLNNPVGSTNLNLIAGHEYQMNTILIAWDGAGTSSFDIQIPGPGAAALLGASGLIALRRRR